MKPTINTPLEFFFDQLHDLYSMEVQLRESKPRLVSLCSNVELRNLITSHAHQNCNQIMEIAAIFGRLGLIHEPAVLSELLAEEKEMVATLMQLEPDLFATAKRSHENAFPIR